MMTKQVPRRPHGDGYDSASGLTTDPFVLSVECECCDRSVPYYWPWLLTTLPGLEQLHDIFWVLKDYAWQRVWPLQITATIAMTTWSITMYVLYMTTCEYRREAKKVQDPFNNLRGRMTVTKLWHGLISTIGLAFWMTGSILWSIVETMTYIQFGAETSISRQILIDVSILFSTAIVILFCLWVYTFQRETWPTSFTYTVRLNNYMTQIQTRAISQGMSTDDANKLLPYHRRTSRDLSRSPTARLEGQSRPLKTEVDSVPSVCPAYEYGLPRRHIGFVWVPPRMPHLRDGTVSESRRLMFVSGYLQMMDYRHLLVFWWVIKDMCWIVYFEVKGDLVAERVTRHLWNLAGGLSCIIALDIFLTMMRNGKFRSFKVQCLVDFTQFLWVVSNILWAFGEIYYGGDDVNPGVVSTPVDQRIFPLFTRLSEIPSGQWQFRHIAAWLSTINVIIFAGILAYYTVFDIHRLIRARRCKSSGLCDLLPY